MGQYNFDQILDRTHTKSLKYDFAVKRGKPADVLPFWVADMDFEIPPELKQILLDRVNHGVFGYTESDDEYFEVTKTYEDGVKWQNDNGEILISLTSNWNPNGESLQKAYDKAVREKPNATYKFLGKTFFTITYEDNGLLIFRKTMYDKSSNKYVYLYVSFPPEYKPYMTPIVERMANSMKKSTVTENNTVTSNITYSNYYNSYYGYSIDYPASSDFYISSNTNDGIEIKSNDENVYMLVTYGYDDYGDNLQEAYNRAVSDYPNAPYKFLGKTFFTITYEEDGLLVFRKTVYDKVNNG